MNYKTYLQNEIHRFVKEHNRVPTARDMGRSERGEYPSIKAYQNHFGSWSEALRSCGYTPNRGRNPQAIYKAAPKCLRKYSTDCLTATRLRDIQVDEVDVI